MPALNFIVAMALVAVAVALIIARYRSERRQPAVQRITSNPTIAIAMPPILTIGKVSAGTRYQTPALPG